MLTSNMIKKASAADIVYFLIRKNAAVGLGNFGVGTNSPNDFSLGNSGFSTGNELGMEAPDMSLYSGAAENSGKSTYNTITGSPSETTQANAFTAGANGMTASRNVVPHDQSQVLIPSEAEIEKDSANDVKKDTLPEQTV